MLDVNRPLTAEQVIELYEILGLCHESDRRRYSQFFIASDGDAIQNIWTTIETNAGGDNTRG